MPRHSPCALSSLTCGVASAGSLPASACLSACGSASLPLLLRLFLANPLRWALLGFIGTFACLPGLEKTWFSFKNYAGFSRVLWLNCIYPAPFRMRSTIKTYFPGFLQASLLPYIVTFQILCSVFKVQSPTAFAVRFEDPTQSGWVFKSNSKSCLVGPSGLEPPTLRLSVVRSSQLSYGPVSGLLSSLLVEIVGIEPATSCLQGRRSPS